VTLRATAFPGLLGAACLVAGLTLVPACEEFFAVDACLDRGGVFDYARSRCDFVVTHLSARSYVERRPVRVSASLMGALLLVVCAYVVRDHLTRLPEAS
jgi:hypothetical protein